MKLITTIRRFWLAIMISTILLLLISEDGLLKGIAEEISKIELKTVFFLVSIQILLWTVQAFAWRETISGLSYKPPTFLRSISHLAALFIGKYIPGKVWGMTARGGDLVLSGISTQATIKITLYEQMLIVFAATLVFVVGASVSRELLLPSLLFAIISSFFLSAFFRISTNLARRVLQIFSKGNSTAVLPNGKPAKNSWFLQWITSLHIVAWALQGLIAVLLAQGIGLTIDGNIANIIAAHAASSLLGFVAVFAPGGFGVREASFITLLENSFELHSIAAVAVMLRMWTIAADLTLGLIGACALSLEPPRK